jgi:hypothetical protein
MHEDSWKRSEIEDSRNEGGGSRFKVRRFERGARGEEFAPPLTRAAGNVEAACEKVLAYSHAIRYTMFR